MRQFNQRKVALVWVVSISLGLFAGCRAGEQEQDVDDPYASEGTTSGTRSASSSSNLVDIPVTLTDADAEASLSLASATAFSISVDSCASGWTATVTEGSSNLQAYKFDSGCLAKLTTFTLNGNTYTPKTGFVFDTWQAGDVATFEDASNTSDTLTVTVVSTISATVDASDEVEYQFSDIEDGGDETIAQADVESSATGHAVTIDGQAAPSFSIFSIEFVGINGTSGAAQFDIIMECSAAVTGTGASTACLDADLADISYKLVADDYSSDPSYTDASDTIFATAGTALNTGTDVVALGTSGTTNGGFSISTLEGPDDMALEPNMLLVLNVNDISYQFFNVDITVITQD